MSLVYTAVQKGQAILPTVLEVGDLELRVLASKTGAITLSDEGVL